MVIVRQHPRSRALVTLGIASVLLLAACGGGGGSSKPSSTPTSGNGSLDSSTTTTNSGGGGNGTCLQPPGPQKARVRFVNLFTNSTYPSGAIDVLQGFSGKDACAKKLATLPFGTASDYIDVTATDDSGDWQMVAFTPGSTDDNHEIISQTETWKGGEQVTFVIQGQDPTSGNGPSAGGDQAFFEKNSAGNTESSLAIAPDKASVGIGAASIQYVVKDGAWVAGVTGKPGCLKATGDTDTTRTNIGGTSVVPYVLDPGSTAISLYPSDPGTCTGTPDIGPLTIDTTAGSRTFVLAYGPDKQHLKLLALPVAS